MVQLYFILIKDIILLLISDFINLNHLFLYYIRYFLLNNLIIVLFFLIINIIIIFFFHLLYPLMINLFLVLLIITRIMVIIMWRVSYFLVIFFIIILRSYLYLQIIILLNSNRYVYHLLSYTLFFQINYSINLSRFFMNGLFHILFLIHLLKLLKFYDLEEISMQIKHHLGKKH